MNPMRNLYGHILLCLALVAGLCLPAAASPQKDGFDRALDEYEAICDRCLGLRMRVEAGEKVEMSALKALLSELSSLRRTLSGASGKMSAAQAERFEAIRSRYISGMGSLRNAQDEGIEKDALRRGPAILPGLAPIAAPPCLAAGQAGVVRMKASRAKIPAKPPKQGWKFAVLADAGIFPTTSFGATAVVTKCRIGAYVSYRSDFKTNEYSYVCTSDGGTEYGRFWASGDSRVSRTVATAGFAMFPSRRLGFYAGAGLTSYSLGWEDTSGQWAKVGDKSYRNFALDGGIFLTFKPLIISLGVTSDFGGHADLRVGAGVRF